RAYRVQGAVGIDHSETARHRSLTQSEVDHRHGRAAELAGRMGELWRKPVRQVGGCCGGDGEHYPIEALALDRPAHLRGREPTDGCAQANAAVQSKGESVRESSQTAAKRPDPAARAFGPAECVDDQRALPGERAEGGKR